MAAIANEPFTTIDKLTERLGVSYATVRRDLVTLHYSGHLTRVRGGVIPSSRQPHADVGEHVFPRFRAQRAQHLERANSAGRQAIARMALNFVRPEIPMIINGGATVLAMASMMANQHYNVLTPSIPILKCLERQERIRITLPGGSLLREQDIMMSPFEDAIMNGFAASRMFMDALAVTQQGLMENDVLLVHSAQKLMKCTREVVVLAESSRINASAALAVCPLSDIDMIITDDRIDAGALKWLALSGIDVRIAHSESH